MGSHGWENGSSSASCIGTGTHFCRCMAYDVVTPRIAMGGPLESKIVVECPWCLPRGDQHAGKDQPPVTFSHQNSSTDSSGSLVAPILNENRFRDADFVLTSQLLLSLPWMQTGWIGFGFVQLRSRQTKYVV